jgi:long-chain acyl-CoA synthetase
VILEHEKVRDAAVKGVPATGARSSLGELVKAYVVREDPSLTDLEVKRHCVDRLESYKVPHEVSFLDELPRNPAGKVVKDQLE